jgi:hypothetical protein
MKNKWTPIRDFYRPKKDDGYLEYKPNLEDLIGYKAGMFEIWINLENATRPKAMFFSGKKAKYDFWNSFLSTDQMKNKINDSIKNLLHREEMKQKRKKEKKEELTNIKKGDLFVSSWGYDQTNVDFYQCTAVKGQTLTFKSIHRKTVKDSEYSHGMADEVTAVKDSFIVDENHPILTKRSLKISSFQYLYPTTETEKHYRSWYA